MLGLLARTVYFLQLSNEKFERQIIINSDRWKAKDFEFCFAYFAPYESRNQRDCAKSCFRG